MISAGRVGRPHGLDGCFYVADAAPELLPVGTRVRVSGQEAEVVERKGANAAPILRLDCADDRSGAIVLRGELLLVPRGEARQLEEDEYWAEDLIGCRVVVAGEQVLGTVRRLLAMPSCEVLELDNERLVPMVRDAILSVDVEAKRIEVDGGFLDAT
jgi:16S rRNA processing protein RimM